jgi:cytochrome c556
MLITLSIYNPEKTMKQHIALLAFASSLLAAGGAQAQFAKPEDAIKYRQSALAVMGAHTGRLGAMVNGRVPFDAKVAQDNADVIATMAKLPWQGFGAGTEGGKAKANIWSDAAKFKAGGDKLAADAARLEVAAKSGNLDQIKAAFGAYAGNCKTCHDEFRNN